MEALAILPFLFLILFGDFGSSGAEVEDTDEADDNGPEPQNNTEETPTITPIIFDDTNDEDNGLLTGTDAAELFIGSLEANGPEGFNSDVTNPNDTITALGGNDTVIGGNGEDQIDGGEGNDLLSGGLDDDTVVGGPGDDTIAGNEGNDVLTGGDGNDVFIISDAEEGLLKRTRISDLNNEEGDRDFVDLTPYFTKVEEAQQALDPWFQVLPLDGLVEYESKNAIVFSDDFTTADLTPETTGLALNIAPVAVDDTVTITDQDYRDFVTIDDSEIPGLVIDVVGGQGEPVSGTDSDVDDDDTLLRVNTINGKVFEPGNESPGYGLVGVRSIQTADDGRSLSITFWPEFVSGVQDVSDAGGIFELVFTYTVVDSWGGESDPATVTVNFVAPDDSSSYNSPPFLQISGPGPSGPPTYWGPNAPT